ncbi:MAG: hypothetical protein MR291_03685 [Oscillospiraceae bacterium]|nr:hypothetical protein [Oscillospiraceae bacterium]
MRAMKLLFSRYIRHRASLLCSAVFFVVMLTAVMLFHADPGSPDSEQGDYLMCKMCGLFPAMFGVAVPSVFLAQETQGSRFLRAVPFAEQIYRTGIPLLCAGVTFFWTAVTDIVYSAFILISGRDIANITDMLALSAVVGFVFTIASCCGLTIRHGGYVFILYYLPFVLIMSMGRRNDFLGLPLWGALLIFIGGSAAGLAACLAIARLAYAKGNFHEITTTQGKFV